MSIATPFHGSLFANDFLRDSVTHLDDWRNISTAALATLESSVRDVFNGFPSAGSPNESQTEDDLIWPVLAQLGWTASLRQQNLSAYGREDVPDGLLFPDAAAKDRANSFAEEWKRYEFGLAVIESKRWGRPLDRRSGRRGEETAPSTQMLRYLRRVDDLTTGKLRWGILTNGARWRLYYQGSRSVSEQFFEMDLAALLDLPGHNEGLFALTEDDRRHWLKVFALVFRREAFLAGTADPRTFHQRAIEEGRFYEERVAASLSALVFGQVFPELASAIAAATPEASLPEVREATLVLLYRLLFILYAEDRDLLPVRNTSYDDYALREKVRGDVRRRKDHDDVFSTSAARYWLAIDDLCRAIDQGDASIGLPPYNGGLFDRKRIPLLANIRLGDDVMAKAIDALSFEQTPNGRRYINYRDLGVQQLGSIYERLLEQEIVRDGSEIAVRPNVFARKGSGSYYTPDDLVGLIIKETIGPLVRLSMDNFTAKHSELATIQLPEDRRISRLKQLDPAEKLLELKVCDPAMGSGHFLINLVDHLADRVITAMAEAEALVDDYISPLTERIDVIRNTIMGNAEERGWAIDVEQLDDRHIVRRMILKRCVYGVDKNPMAVELAKVSLWLHTFTVGAPLSFLDHHLRCGDSLFGSWVRTGIDRATEQGGPLFLQGPLKRATRAAAPMQIIEGLTDAEIEWFASRRREIALAQRAADRKRMIADLEKAGDPLAHDFATASDRAVAATRMARTSGDYPLLSSGDINLYSLFVERAMTIVKPDGMVGLLTPSGIASDKTAARFFKGVSTQGKLRALYDFENKKVFFPDVHASFKFCVFVASPSPVKDPARCAFYLHSAAELDDPERCFPLTAADFDRVNPNTGTAPIFRTRRDAELTTAVYGRLPVLVDRSSGEEVQAWPVKYTTMFHMTNDSGLFRTRVELEEREGAYPIGGNRFASPSGDWVPLYEGKMVQAFDHRAANIIIKPENQHRPAQPVPATLEQHRNADWFPDPQFWVPASECGWTAGPDWVLGFKEITAPTNVRTFIASLLPTVAFGNKVPILKPEAGSRAEWLLAANLNAIILDFVARQKVQGQTLNLFIVEQLPVVPPSRYEAVSFGPKTAGEILREAVLELTYTAHDMAPFARDMGYVDKAGKVKSPFTWDEARRLHLRAKLDAVFFHLYGVTDRDDIRYIYSTFPIVEREEKAVYGGVYRSCELCLAYMNALADGNPDAEVRL